VTRMFIAAMALCCAMGLAFAAGDQRCKVTDPTGTPLNVRDGPNGKIIGTLANGSTVAIVAEKNAANGKAWAKVVDYATKKPLGWVFREFVFCF
jgi:hypothetical protein